MATTQSASLQIDARVNAQKNGKSGVGAIAPTVVQWTYGTTASAADKGYYDQITIVNTGTPQSVDFSGGGLIDVVGDTITWAELVLLVVSCPSVNTVNVTVGGGSNPLDIGMGSGTSVGMAIHPGECKVLINCTADPAYPITGGSADTLKLFIPSAANQVIEVLAVGRSA